jgi:hypothetical protein
MPGHRGRAQLAITMVTSQPMLAFERRTEMERSRLGDAQESRRASRRRPHGQRRSLIRVIGAIVAGVAVTIVLSGVYGWIYGGPWLSFDPPAVVSSRVEAISIAGRVPGTAWPGTRVDVTELPDGSLLVERTWLSMLEAHVVVTRVGADHSIPIDGLTGLSYGIGERVQAGAFAIGPATAIGAFVLLWRRTPRRRSSGAEHRSR